MRFTEQSPLQPVGSLVCGERHVIDDEVMSTPDLGLNGKRRCDRPSCSAAVYSHCENFHHPLPAYMDGPRYEGSPTLRVPTGRTDRTFHELCPSCKFPYPWASKTALIGYEDERQKDLAEGRGALREAPIATRAYRATRLVEERKVTPKHRRSIPDWFEQKKPAVDTVNSFIKLVQTALLVTVIVGGGIWGCLLYTSPSPRDATLSRMPSSA